MACRLTAALGASTANMSVCCVHISMRSMRYIKYDTARTLRARASDRLSHKCRGGDHKITTTLLPSLAIACLWTSLSLSLCLAATQYATQDMLVNACGLWTCNVTHTSGPVKVRSSALRACARPAQTARAYAIRYPSSH